MSHKKGRRKFIKKSLAGGIGLAVSPGIILSKGSADQIVNGISGSKGDSDITLEIDWPEMMKGFDLIWKMIPEEMSEAPHTGNGIIGSMIWVDKNSIRLQVFRPDVHDHNDHRYGWTAYSRPRYQIGYFLHSIKGTITACDIRQDIYNAEIRGKISTTEGAIEFRHLTHRETPVIYTDLQVSGNEEYGKWKWVPFKAEGSRGGDPGDAVYGRAYAPYKKYKNPEPVITKNGDIWTSMQEMTAGGTYSTSWKDGTVKGRPGTLLISIENTYPGKNSGSIAVNTIQKAEALIINNFSSWIARHREWWHDYYPQSFVSFPEARGQAFYWNNVYRLACCTRPDSQYIDTPGMWNSGGPWPYSTHDFNTQTVHFPVYTSNRLHLGEALVNSLNKNQKNLVENVVPEEWQEDSALLNLATAYDLKGKRNGDARYNEMLGCLPWLLNNCWLHYRYTMDEDILRETVYPLLRRSINLYRHILYEGEDGKLHLPPTFSPEIGNYADCNFDLSLLKWGCLRLIDISGILDIDDPLIPEWQNIVNKLTDFPNDTNGYMLGKDSPADLNHRHMSHLMMVYPLYLENIDNEDSKDLVKKSVINYEAKELPKMGASQSSPAAAAVGMGNLAYQRMNDILYSDSGNEKLGKNGMYYLATPCIETSLSYNTCVQDMLLQSWGNRIRVFPALPDKWKDVSFHNFRAEGAFLISASRRNGITEFVRIKSLAGEPCVISASFEGNPVVKSRNKRKISEVSADCYKIDLGKGEEIILYSEGHKKNHVIGFSKHEKDDNSRFGKY